MSALIKPDTRGAVDAFTVRVLGPGDAGAFRDIRLEALEKDGRYFTASYEKESGRSKAEWVAACTETCDQVVFGAVRADGIIGVVAASRWDGDPSGKSVRWGSAYARREWRRVGVIAVLCEAREEWSRQHGFEQAVFTIRADNSRSIAIHLAHGAKQIREEPMRFADGSVATAIWHAKPLAPT